MAELRRASEPTPAQLLSVRLEKLEKDLQLLTGMQTLLLSTGIHVNGPDNCASSVRRDIPERDVSPNRKKTSAAPKNRKQKPVASAASVQGSIGTQESYNDHVTSKVTKCTETDESGCDNRSLELLEALKDERERRLSVEESARMTGSQLQQVKEELTKERETKQMLLVGTLQLKNQISSHEAHIRECEGEINQLKVEIRTCRQTIGELSADKVAIAKKFKDLITSLKDQKKILQADNSRLMAELKDMDEQLAEQKQHVALMEQSLQSLEQKHVTKVNQLAVKYAQVDKERQDLAQALRTATEKCDTSVKERDELREALGKLHGEMERESMLKDCLLKKLKSDMIIQREQFEAQIKNSQEVISKTKALILQVRKERDELRELHKQCEQSNRELEARADGAIANYKNLNAHYESFKNRIKRTLAESQSSLERLKKENSSLKAVIASLRKDKAAQSERALAAENEFLREKSNFEGQIKSLQAENENLRSELSRCMDNFRVLQKISDDQGQRIQAMRAEKEDQRKIKFQLESELRERDANETTLTRKLEQEQRRSAKLEESIAEYEKRLDALELEIREHNCDDFVQSSLRKKLKEMEQEVKERYEEWQEALEEARAEREKAQREARNYQKLCEEAKSELEVQLLEVSSRSKQEIQRLKTDSKRNLAEKAAKILELETELEQCKANMNQIQQTLMGKIKQLQCALSVCVSSNLGGHSALGANIGPVPFCNLAGF